MFCQPAFGEEDIRASRLNAEDFYKESMFQPNLWDAWDYLTSSRAAQLMPSPGPIQPPQKQFTNNSNINFCNEEKYVYKTSTCHQQQQASMLQQQLQLQLQQEPQDNPYQQEILIQQKQQYWPLLNQRQQLAVASAFNAVNSAVNSENNKRNEISKSLQMFAAKLTNSCENGLNNAGNEYNRRSDVIGQDFADNGYTNDKFNNYQVQQHQQHNNNICYIDNSIKQQREHAVNTQFPNWYFNYSCKQDNESLSPKTSDYVQKKDHNLNEKNKMKRNYKKNSKTLMTKHCVFCENNKEPEAVVNSHAVRDVFGRVLCPKLRSYVCPICKSSGDFAHTIKYCPKKRIITMEDAIKAESFRLSKATFLKQKMKI